MRKKGLVLIGCAVIFFFCAQGAWADAVKVGVLNMKTLQQNSLAFQKVRDGLKKKFDKLQKKLEGEKAQIQKLQGELQKQSMMLSLDAREDKQRELEQRTRHYNYVYGEVTQEMKDAEMDATRKVGIEIEKIVEKLAEKGKYTIILEAEAVGLVYYDNTIDVTDRVTKAYDKAKLK